MSRPRSEWMHSAFACLALRYSIATILTWTDLIIIKAPELQHLLTLNASTWSQFRESRAALGSGSSYDFRRLSSTFIRQLPLHRVSSLFRTLSDSQSLTLDVVCSTTLTLRVFITAFTVSIWFWASPRVEVTRMDGPI